MLTVRIHAPINPTGIGTHAQYLLNELIQLSESALLKLQICPIGTVSYSTKRDIARRIGSFLLTQNVTEKPNAIIVLDTPRKCNQWFDENYSFVETGVSLIAYTVFELIPVDYPGNETIEFSYRNELVKLDRFDRIWVPSIWGKRVIDHCFPHHLYKVQVVPEGIANFDHKRQDPVYGYPNLTIGTVGKFERRKGHYELIDALQSLDAEGLYINFKFWGHNWWNLHGLRNHLLALKWKDHGGKYFFGKGCSIEILGHSKWQEDVVQDWEGVGTMVFPTKSEGWGLPIGESIGLGIPTLSTGLTGSSDFFGIYDAFVKAKTGFSNRISIGGNFQLGKDPPFFNGEGFWYQVDSSDIAKAIAHMASRPSCSINPYESIAYKMKDEFSWYKSAIEVVRLLGI
jgi:glycosyltransferase involved in cell wall biosynthesis